MLDDIHAGIHSVDDIKTFEEAIEEYKDGVAPDFTKYMIDKAIKNNSIAVYSSYPIENGTFVTPSKMIANDFKALKAENRKLSQQNKKSCLAVV